MKKSISIFLTLLLLVVSFSFTSNAETYVPTRTINLVYDDSGSMIRTGGSYLDTWCQAKYAMEVVTAMLGEQDTLNIYYMSDYVEGTSAPPLLSLIGSKNAKVTAANVQKVHNTVTDASETPFNSVKKAYQDLTKTTTDEKWLVVLTDGEFDVTNDRVENYFDDCVADGSVKVMMLSMGPNAAAISADPSRGIYFEKAVNTTDILSKLTKICNQIFQNNELPMNGLSSSFSVPMSELIVFAQGKDVKIESITDDAGNMYGATSNVQVMYSEVATIDKNYPQESVIIADDLMGYVATFNCDFNPGTYNFNITGADDVQVYYKPNVTIAAYLYNKDNEEVTGKDTLVAGEYRVEYGFVNATNGEKVTDTSLMGDITYASSIINVNSDGVENVIEANNGDMITIEDGSLQIDVAARFLEYNTVYATLRYDTFRKDDLIYEVTSKPDYVLDIDGLHNGDKPIEIEVKLAKGNEVLNLTPEQWAILETDISLVEDTLGPLKVEKTKEVGTYLLYPTLKDEDPLKTGTGTFTIKAEGGFKEGLSSADGEMTDTFEIKNEISDWERFKEWFKENWLKCLIGFLIFLFILGYIPPFKKYLPRKIKKRPFIECGANKIGVRDTQSHGKYKRKLMSTLIPYKAETGFVVFSPSPHKKTAQLRAAGGNGMYVTNMKMFAGKPEFTFNGMPIEENRTKPYRISGGSTISLKTTEYVYTCYLNR